MPTFLDRPFSTPLAAQARRSSGDLPSYARPTAVSEYRRASIINERGARKPVSQRIHSRQKSSLSTIPSKALALPRYMLPTGSSRSKTTLSNSFKFFNLPPEIRNSIYQQVVDSASRVRDLHRGGQGNALACLPTLLATNKQVREEAGGYYFTKGHFVILNPGLCYDNLKAWLKMIGNKNRRYLANNRNVTIRFILPWAEFTDGESQSLRSLFYARVMTLDDVAQLSGLSIEHENLTQEYPMLRHWQL